MRSSYYVMPVLILIIFIYSFIKKKDAYTSFINGSKEGAKTSLKVMPYIISMFVAIKVLNASGLVTDIINIPNIPTSLLLQGIFKPFSNNASQAFMLDNFISTGVDSNLSFVSSVFQSSKDTTVYILTLYFGSVGVIHHKYALKVGIICDIFCFVLCLLLYYFL